MPFRFSFFRASPCLWWPEDSQEPQPTCPVSPCSFSDKKPYSKPHLSQEFPAAEPYPCLGARGKEVESGEFQSHLGTAPNILQTRLSTEHLAKRLSMTRVQQITAASKTGCFLHCSALLQFSFYCSVASKVNSFVSENHTDSSELENVRTSI